MGDHEDGQRHSSPFAALEFLIQRGVDQTLIWELEFSRSGS